MRAIIAGGGIGGLAAALSLNQVGINVRVFESSRELKPLGVGINILPNASRELCALGLQPELDRMAVRTRAMRYFTRRGKLLISGDCGEHAGYRWPQYSLHRGEFQLLMARTLIERAGENSLVTGHKLTDFEQNDERVTAQFADPESGELVHSETADVLIGADGLHSVTRAKLLPGEGKPLPTGMMTFRGAVKAPPYLDGESMIIAGDNRLRLVSYPITPPDPDTGLAQINWIAVFPDDDTSHDESWESLMNPRELEARYADWRFDWLDVPALLGATERIMPFPVFDRDPLSRWSFSRVTMIGDAAHPLIPVSSSGAVQAIIDARALAFALARNDDPIAGLKAYEDDRMPKANAVVVASRANGPDEVLEIARREVPDDADDVHAHVSMNKLQSVLDDFKEKAGFGIERLNNLPSYEP